VEFQTVRGYDDDRMDELTESLIEQVRVATGITNVTSDGAVTARASGDRTMNAFLAVGAALVLILIYMLFRFKFSSGVAAIIGLFHDVLMMLALTAIFRIEMNAAFVAGVITVIAYSLNNTIILFDRIRSIEKHNENRQSVEEMVDRGVKETFVRTMNTTITTFVPIFILIILGVPLIREFALPILFGLIAGTFSTIFVTTSLYVRFENSKLAVRRRKKLAAAKATN